MIKIKNQGYISLHVTEINELRFTSFHVIFYVISCRTSFHVARHFMLYFTSFYVIFHTFHCTHYMHCTHITHVAHFTLHAHRTFHALHHISRHFMYYFMSFHHENSLHSHSCHLALKREERGSKCQALQ